jgi:DNA-binding NarL/FixJ family response regulator
VSSALQACRDIVVQDTAGDEAGVALVVSDDVNDETLRALRALKHSSWRPVLVFSQIDDAGLAAAVEAGVAGLVRRADATPERLAEAVSSAARGEGAVPPDLLGRLLEQIGRIHRQILGPQGLSLTGFADREVKILRLVSEGLDTCEIATRLSYSERTVKNVLHDVTTRLQLRNRSQAVAYAVRQGVI